MGDIKPPAGKDTPAGFCFDFDGDGVVAGVSPLSHGKRLVARRIRLARSDAAHCGSALESGHAALGVLSPLAGLRLSFATIFD